MCLFFIIYTGDKVKIYLDLILFLNFAFDFLLLLSVALILRRKVTLNRLLTGSFIGSLTILVLFININSFWLFMIKIFFSILMVLVTFGFESWKYTLKNILFLYTSSILLGGFLYFLNIQFSYKNNGLVFYFEGLSINYIVLLILGPLIIYLYIKQSLNLKSNYANYYPVTLYLDDNNTLDLTGYYDTGNKLIDPYLNRPVILINKNKLPNFRKEYIYIPYNSVTNHGLLKCIRIPKIKINNQIKYNILLGLMEEKINIDGIDCLLHYKLWEEN